MTTLKDAYINALLADATYALESNVPNVLNGLTGNDLTVRLNERMTPTLAQYIGDNFTVVTHVDSSEYVDSGFDATVWRDNNTGKTYVSMTGTEGVADFVTDIDLTLSGVARTQVADMVNWWLKNTTPIGQDAKQIMLFGGIFLPAPSTEGTGILSDVSTVVVNGHSLGGHLATAFTRLFGGQWDIEHTYTYNSAGFTITSGLFFNNIDLILGQGVGMERFPNENEQSNFFADNRINFIS